MMKDLESEQNYFGIMLFEPGDAAITRPVAGTTGCLAEVREFHPLPDGASNILTMGIIRYRLIDYIDTGEPYFVGDVEFFEDQEESGEKLDSLADDVHELFKRVAKAAFQLSGSRGKLPDIPNTNPQDLSFLIATAFNLDNTLKYQMLETDSTSDRLNKLHEILVHTVDKMEESAKIQKVAATNGHTEKKIDI